MVLHLPFLSESASKVAGGIRELAMLRYAVDRWSADTLPQPKFRPFSGGRCPVSARELVRVRHRDGQETTDYASEYVWVHLGKDFDVIGYRLVDASGPTMH